MYLNYKDYSMLTGQTGLPPNQLTSLKVKNMHNFGIFQPIWLKFGMESVNGGTQHMYVICTHLAMLSRETNPPPNQPTGLNVKNLHNFDIFQPIGLKVGMESLKGITQHMQTIYSVKPAHHPTSLLAHSAPDPTTTKNNYPSTPYHPLITTKSPMAQK